SQRALATLMSNLPGMAYRCRNDPDWTMEFVSDGALALTGYRPEDLVGNRVVAFAQLIHPEDRAPVWDEVQAALAECRSFQLTYRIATQ
ncbi:PAS domain-containing protein, partial [Staphylococcus aureus]